MGTGTNLCFRIKSPNNKIETLVSNNSICKEFEILSLEEKLVNTNSDYTISPNPFTDVVTLNNDNPERITNVTIYNMNGSNIFTNTKIKDNKLDLTFLDRGVYLIKIGTETNVYSKKIIKN